MTKDFEEYQYLDGQMKGRFWREDEVGRPTVVGAEADDEEEPTDCPVCEKPLVPSDPPWCTRCGWPGDRF